VSGSDTDEFPFPTPPTPPTPVSSRSPSSFGPVLCSAPYSAHTIIDLSSDEDEGSPSVQLLSAPYPAHIIIDLSSDEDEGPPPVQLPSLALGPRSRSLHRSRSRSPPVSPRGVTLTHLVDARATGAVGRFYGLHRRAVPWRERGRGHFQCRIGREIVNLYPSTGRVYLNGKWSEEREEAFQRVLRLDGLV